MLHLCLPAPPSLCAEYERLSGRSASKKWKWSIRVDKGGGSPGPTLEEWLTEHGLDGAAAPRASRGTLATVHRQQQQQLLMQQGGGGGSGGAAAATPAGGSAGTVGQPGECWAASTAQHIHCLSALHTSQLQLHPNTA